MLSTDERSQLLAFVRREVARQLNTVLNGTAGPENTVDSEDISDLFPGMPTLVQRPVVLPFGLASRAPQGMLSVSARNGDHPGARYVIGHRDSQRPAHERGETVLYNTSGKQVRLELGAIRIGGPGASENLVLGQKLKELLTAVDQAVADIGAAVATLAPYIATIPGLSPQDQIAIADAGVSAGAAGQAASSADSSLVANDAILSDESFTRKGP